MMTVIRTTIMRSDQKEYIDYRYDRNSLSYASAAFNDHTRDGSCATIYRVEDGYILRAYQKR